MTTEIERSVMRLQCLSLCYQNLSISHIRRTLDIC
jgi:hypothetical protein